MEKTEINTRTMETARWNSHFIITLDFSLEIRKANKRIRMWKLVRWCSSRHELIDMNTAASEHLVSIGQSHQNSCQSTFNEHWTDHSMQMDCRRSFHEISVSRTFVKSKLVQMVVNVRVRERESERVIKCWKCLID